MKITESALKKIEVAAAELRENGQNIIDIPDGNGLKLVKFDTPPAHERLEKNSEEDIWVLTTVTVGDEKFLVCLQ